MVAEVVIPRALSVDEADRHYRADWKDIGPLLTIFLDGVQQTHVITYNQDEGFVVRCLLDPEGRVQINPNVPDEVWTEKVRGLVEVSLRLNLHSDKPPLI